MSARSSPVPADDIPDLDLPLFDTLSHSNYYYNQNQSIIYSQGNALDLLYETTIDSTIRRKESLTHSKAIPAEWTGALALAQRENDESRGNAQLSRSSPAGETLKKENRDSDEIPAEIRPSAREIPAGNVDSVHEKTAGNEEMAAGLLLSPPDLPPKTAGAVEEEPRELCTECQRTAVYSTFRGKGAGFTQLQAIQFLLENSIPEIGSICLFRRRDHVPRGRAGLSESAAESSDAGANQIRASVPHDAVPRDPATAAAALRVPGD